MTFRSSISSAQLPALRSSRRVAALEKLIDGFALLGSKHPGANPDVYGVDITRDVPYLPTGSADHTLDVYTPQDRRGPLPVVLYVHGGGFRLPLQGHPLDDGGDLRPARLPGAQHQLHPGPEGRVPRSPFRRRRRLAVGPGQRRAAWAATPAG